MEFLRLVLVFLHLLGMAVLVASFLLDRRAAAGAPLNKGWLHGSLLQLVTGIALEVLGPHVDKDYDHVKLGVKLIVLLVITGLAIAFTRRTAKPPAWVSQVLVGLVVVNVGIAVFWS